MPGLLLECCSILFNTALSFQVLHPQNLKEWFLPRLFLSWSVLKPSGNSVVSTFKTDFKSNHFSFIAMNLTHTIIFSHLDFAIL